LTRIKHGEAVEGLIEGNKIRLMRGIASGDVDLVEGNRPDIEATLPGCPTARVIDQQPSREFRRNSQKVGAILPRDSSLIQQPEVHLVGYGGGKQRMAGAFSTELLRGNSAQLWVDRSEHILQRGLVSRLPLVKHLRDIRILIQPIRLLNREQPSAHIMHHSHRVDWLQSRRGQHTFDVVPGIFTHLFFRAI
jgi:hypothetical protein